MATVYSLICWGGGYGKAVGVSIGSPCYVTYTNPVNASSHGLQDGTPVVFSSNGDTLPTGLAFNTTYYTRSNYVNEVFLFTTEAAAVSGDIAYRVNTTGAQSGTHILKSKEMLDLVASYPDRWPLTRVFDSMSSWNAGRSGASPYDTEVCEIGMSFDDYIFWSVGLVISVPSSSILITTKVNGKWASGFHYGSLSRGYRLVSNYDYSGSLLTLRNYRCRAIGFTIKSVRASLDILIMGVGAVAEKMILAGPGSAGTGIKTTVFSYNYHCLAYGCGNGIYTPYGAVGSVIANCIVVKNSNGFNSGSSGVDGFYYSNISIGNTTNWRQGVSLSNIADSNAGLSAEAWTSSGKSRVIIATSDFVDFANNDFRPATYTSPQVDTGIVYYEAPDTDIADAEAPNYNNGGSEARDLGCYEFDHGYGPHPASTTVTFVGVNAGSEIRVFNTAGVELAGVESSSANPVLSWVLPVGDVTIKVVADAYVLIEFTYSSIAGAVALPIQQALDRWYSNP